VDAPGGCGGGWPVIGMLPLEKGGEGDQAENSAIRVTKEND